MRRYDHKVIHGFELAGERFFIVRQVHSVIYPDAGEGSPYTEDYYLVKIVEEWHE